MAPQRRNPGGTRRSQDDDEGGDEPGLTDSMRDEIGQIVNAAVSGHVQRKLPAIVQSAIATPLAELRTLLEGAGGGRGRAAAGDEDDADDDEPEVPPRRSARGADRGRVAARGRRDRERVDREEPAADRRGGEGDSLAKMQAKVDRMERERAEERQASRAALRDGSLRDLLGAAGVDKNRIRGAAAVMRESTRYDEKLGEWSFVRKVDGVDEEIDLETGVREWAATDEGKSYLAPPAAAGAFGGGRQQQLRTGSGTRTTGGSGGAPRAGSNSPSVDAKTAKAQSRQAAAQQLQAAVESLAGGAVPLG